MNAQADLALKKANRHRLEKGAVRARIHAGELPVADVLRDPPECLKRTLLYDVLLLAPKFGLSRLRAVNLRAMRAGVNLAVPLARASKGTRRWLADELEGKHVKASSGGIASGSRPAPEAKEPQVAPAAPPGGAPPAPTPIQSRRRVGHARPARRLSGRLVA